MILTIITLILWIIVGFCILISPKVTKLEYVICLITLLFEILINMIYLSKLNDYKDKYNKAEEFKQQMILENNKLKEQDSRSNNKDTRN